MPEANDTSGGSNSINIASFVALLLLIAGILLVPKKLSSSRPVSPNVGNDPVIGANFVQARLWEDPLKWATNATGKASFDRIKELRSELLSNADGTNVPMLLAVMIHGGTYAEDYESRLRSRFAVVSALGTRGYVPESGTTIGTALVPWRTDQDWKKWINDGYFGSHKQRKHTGGDWSKALPLSFEWYRLSPFVIKDPDDLPRRVFVLWLNEDYFQRHPLVKLAWLFRQLAYEPDATKRVEMKFALVGPGQSDTLREMLPPYDSSADDLRIGMHDTDKRWLRNILSQIDVYSATVGAMDEVLVRTNCAVPRKAIKDALTSPTNGWFGFKSFNDFSVTASQLAQETYDELKLRNIDVCRKNKHLVLVTEWDTFYGRTFPLAFAAELATRQSSTSNSTSRLQFIERYRESENHYWPSNLHRFRYLRSLDGQNSGAPSAQLTLTSDSAEHKMISLNDIKRWTPDENKAVGPSQFDYLARLGDAIKDLQDEIRNDNGGRIDAIGIGGSDVYDVLLILQALRPRFPESVFFTTDIDARFSDPDEQSWARNLIVVSGYGLQLHPDLQRRIAPFRDSSQTAQFAAVLGALGDPKVQNAQPVPRRFEIIRGGIEDLSTKKVPLHPPPRKEITLRKPKFIAGLLLMLISGCLLSSIYILPLRKVTWEHHRTEIEALWLREEDLGGEAGADLLIRTLGSIVIGPSPDSFARWLNDQLTQAQLSLSRGDAEEDQALRSCLVLDCLNRQVLQNSIPEQVVRSSNIITPDAIREFEQARLERLDDRAFSRNSIRRLKAHRRIIHEALVWLIAEPAHPNKGNGSNVTVEYTND